MLFLKAMKVIDLKCILEELPDDMEIILQKDGEGNSYSPCAGADSNVIYMPAITIYNDIQHVEWYGDAYSLDRNAEDHMLTQQQWQEIKKQPKVLILYPVN